MHYIVNSRSGRHADAIFTNSYRKVLGQISARKFLQSVMGKRLGQAQLQFNLFSIITLQLKYGLNFFCLLSREDSERFEKRQSGIYEDTFKQDLTAIEKEERYRGHEQDIQRLRYLALLSTLKCLSPTDLHCAVPHS